MLSLPELSPIGVRVASSERARRRLGSLGPTLSVVSAATVCMAFPGTALPLLGTREPAMWREWVARLDGGTVVDDLQQQPWEAWDGQVIDRFGVHWLIGFEVPVRETQRQRGVPS